MVRNDCEYNTFTTYDNINVSNDDDDANNDNNNGLRNQWQTLKLEGDQLFRSGQYRQASMAYQSAFDIFTAPSSSTEGGGGQVLNGSSSSSSSGHTDWREGAILQSNLVACYLKLQELDKALELSQTIVRDYPRWAKGYVRLASTYSSLHRSNDACNALQHALQLDPNHPTAKSMLARELRGRNHHPSAAATSSTTTTNNTVDLEEDLPSETAATYANHWKDRILRHIHKFKEWYNTLNSDYQSLLMVFILIISLYISFGGRFGLGKTRNNTLLHSHEEYNYNTHHFTTTSKTTNDHYGQWKKKQNQKKRQLFSLQRLLPKHVSLLDGSVASMICLALILYFCQRFGIQPLHAIMVIQWIQRANRHHPHPNFNRMFFLNHRRRNAFRF